MLGDSEKGTVLRDGVLAFFLSSVMYYVGLTCFLFVCPLLRFSANHNKKAFGYVALAELGYVVGYTLYISSGSDMFAFSMVSNLFIPVSLLAAGAIWLFASEVKWQKRLFLSFLPAIVLTAFVAVYLNMDRALFASVYDRYRNVFADLLSTLLDGTGQMINSDNLFEVMAVSVGVMMLPVILAAVCASCFYYENCLYSKESKLDEKVAEIELDQNLIWVFLLLFFGFIVSYFISMPMVMNLAITSLFLSALLVYAIQGFSVVFVWIRRISESIRCGSVFVLLVLVGVMVPGLNTIVLMGLPVIGVLENFFNLKIRRNK